MEVVKHSLFITKHCVRSKVILLTGEDVGKLLIRREKVQSGSLGPRWQNLGTLKAGAAPRAL